MSPDPVRSWPQYPASSGQMVTASTLVQTKRSFWHPRWPLLAAILFTPVSLIGYAVKLYYLPNLCTFGGICQLDTLPGLDQVLGIWLGYVVFWGLVFMLGRSLDGQIPPRPGSPAAFLATVSRHEAVRGLLAVLGIAAGAGIVAAVHAGLVDPAGFAMAAIVIFVALRVVTYTSPAV